MKYLSNSKSIFPLSNKAFVKKRKTNRKQKKTCKSMSLYFFNLISYFLMCFHFDL